MKKFLTILCAIVFVFLGAITFASCQTKTNYNGYYKLTLTVNADNGLSFVSEEDMNTEVYIKVTDDSIEEYTYFKSSNNLKNLISLKTFLRNKKNKLFSEFKGEGEDTTYYREYTNLTGDVASNPYKYNFKQYVKVESLPTIADNSFNSYSGVYVNDNEKYELDKTVKYYIENTLQKEYFINQIPEEEVTFYIFKCDKDELKLDFSEGVLKVSENQNTPRTFSKLN